MSEIDLSIVVLTWNTRELVLQCLDGIDAELRGDATADLVIETFVVDNGSQDGTAEAVRDRHPWVQLIALPENVGYARGNNAAIASARGRVVLLLNSDVSIDRAAVLRCLEVLRQSPDAGAAGPHLVHVDGRPQNSMHPFPSFWTELLPSLWLETLWPQRFPSKRHLPRETRDVDAVRGAAFFVKREVIAQVGALAEDYFFFLEETDWCLRMRAAGWRVLFVPDARVVHRLGASSKRVDPLATRIEYHRSLYHFLRVHRGAATARAVRAIRVWKSLGSVALLGLAAPFSPNARRRGAERRGLLRWHHAGCPAEGGLASLSLRDSPLPGVADAADSADSVDSKDSKDSKDLTSRLDSADASDSTDSAPRGRSALGPVSSTEALDEVAETREPPPPGVASPARGER